MKLLLLAMLTVSFSTLAQDTNTEHLGRTFSKDLNVEEDEIIFSRTNRTMVMWEGRYEFTNFKKEGLIMVLRCGKEQPETEWAQVQEMFPSHTYGIVLEASEAVTIKDHTYVCLF